MSIVYLQKTKKNYTSGEADRYCYVTTHLIVVIITGVTIILAKQEETKLIPSPITSPEKSPFTTSLPTLRTPRNRLIGFNNLSSTDKVEETVRRGFHVPFPEQKVT